MTWSPFFTRGDARPDIDHDAGALMAEDRREQPFGIGARQRELVGVADAGRLDLDQHLAGLRAFEVDLHDLQRLGLFHGDGGAGLHRLLLVVNVIGKADMQVMMCKSCVQVLGMRKP